MGWSGGTYTRDNGTYTGSGIWASEAGDADPTIKSSNHDLHDQDLADGINACINKDGSNAFTGNANLGGFKVTNMAEGTATGNAGRWNEDVASIGLSGTSLVVTFNDGSTLSQDLSGIASAGEVTLTGDQTITGQKTFTTNPTIFTHQRTLGTSYVKVNELTAGASVTVDITANSRFYLGNNQAMTLNFTIPAAASDDDLGADFCTTAAILIRNETGAGALTLSVTADDTEEIGSRPTTAGALYTLVIECWVLNGTTRYVQFTYVTV